VVPSYETPQSLRGWVHVLRTSVSSSHEAQTRGVPGASARGAQASTRLFSRTSSDKPMNALLSPGFF